MEHTYNRVDLAKGQLDVALELFLSGRSFVSALTLAGAAEEIFGRGLEFKGEKTTLRDIYGRIAPIETLLRRKPFPWNEYVSEENLARNAAKHMDQPSQSSVTIDMADEAAKMLSRACDHYRRLGFPVTDHIAEFDDWFYRNVVGMDDYL